MANDCILALDDLLSPLEQELETDNTNDCLINNKLQAAVAEQQPPPGFGLGDLDSEAYLAMPQKQISAKTTSLAVVFEALETAVQLSSEEESPERVGDVLRRLKQLFVELSSRILDISLIWERIASDGIPIYTVCNKHFKKQKHSFCALNAIWNTEILKIIKNQTFFIFPKIKGIAMDITFIQFECLSNKFIATITGFSCGDVRPSLAGAGSYVSTKSMLGNGHHSPTD